MSRSRSAASSASGCSRSWCSGFLLWLLSDILLPFVAGIALAYLQTPLADRLERAWDQPHRRRAADRRDRRPGDHRRGAAGRSDTCCNSSPGWSTIFRPTSRALQSYLSDPSRPWLTPDHRHAGYQQDRSSTWSSEGAGWHVGIPAFGLRPAAGRWRPFISLLIVMPVVAFYLIVDWHAHGRHRRQLGAAPSPAEPCASSPARSILPSPASCAGRPPSA